MKRRITPVDQQRVMRDEDFIVSKTDAKGRITYANRIFMEFAGYTERELLGSQHNIVRHPDMPRGVFALMWEVLETGSEFFGYVKNMAGDGSFYWTFANVTPTLDPAGRVVGYFSVRRRPRPEAVAFIEPVYAQMLAREKEVGAKQAVAASLDILRARYQSRGVAYDEFVLAL
jgi:PAS domain S-box-containing protein